MKGVFLAVGAVLALHLVACSDEISIEGRLLPAGDGPGFAGFEAYVSNYPSAHAVVGDDGGFVVTFPPPGKDDQTPVLEFDDPDRPCAVTLVVDAGGASGDVDVGDVVGWNPQFNVNVDDAGVAARWTPPPVDLEGTIPYAEIGDIDLDVTAGQASEPGWVFEDRDPVAAISWRSDVYTDTAWGLEVSAGKRIGLFAPSAAAGAPCSAYRLAPVTGERPLAIVDPCMVTDRDDETSFDLSDVPAGSADMRGIAVNLGSSIPVSRIVVRTAEPAQAGRILLADKARNRR